MDCSGLIQVADRPTALKTRVIAHQQHVVRIDRERKGLLADGDVARLVKAIRKALPNADAVVVGDYAKGVVTQGLLEALKADCRQAGVWLSVDPKPANGVVLDGLSLVTPNRKEAFELAGREDDMHAENPLKDVPLLRVAEDLLDSLEDGAPADHPGESGDAALPAGGSSDPYPDGGSGSLRCLRGGRHGDRLVHARRSGRRIAV